jgi:hypothetical protein
MEDFDFDQTGEDVAPSTAVGDLAAMMIDFIHHDKDEVKRVIIGGIVVAVEHESGVQSILTRTTEPNTQQCLSMWNQAGQAELEVTIRGASKMVRAREAKIERLEMLLRMHGVDFVEGEIDDDDGEG